MITVYETNYKETWNKLKSIVCDNMIDAIKQNDHKSSKIFSDILSTMSELDKEDDSNWAWLKSSYSDLQGGTMAITSVNNDIVDKIKLMISDLYIEKHKSILLKMKSNRENYPESIICKGAIYCLQCCFKKSCESKGNGFTIFDYELEIITAIDERLEEVKA